ncbi:MAG: hypothetical protein RIC52_01540 [Amphiplicatus sp.]
MGKLVEIHYEYDLVDAICAYSFLDSHGVYAIIQNENHLRNTASLLSVALGGYRILVHSADAEEARRLFGAARRGEHRLPDDFDEAALA